jgi:hypothetical protein
VKRSAQADIAGYKAKYPRNYDDGSDHYYNMADDVTGELIGFPMCVLRALTEYLRRDLASVRNHVATCIVML